MPRAKSKKTTAAADATASGITTDASGERFIPASTRADGSTRKEIRVRPGFRPQEDVEIYKNRAAEAFKNRGKGGVLGAEGLKDEESSEAKSAAAAKNAKRREARKRAKATEGGDQDDDEAVADGQGKETADAAKEDTAEHGDSVTTAETEQIERDKKVKKLKKKLREARELQSKKEKGDTLLEEQFEKILKIRYLTQELEQLGISQDSEAA